MAETIIASINGNGATASPTPSPTPVEAPTPVPIPSATPTPSSTPLAEATPTPSAAPTPDPIAWLLQHRKSSPLEVTLKKGQQYAIIIAGKPSGFVTMKSGNKVLLVSFDATHVTTRVGDSLANLDIKETDLTEQALAAMTKAEGVAQQSVNSSAASAFPTRTEPTSSTLVPAHSSVPLFPIGDITNSIEIRSDVSSVTPKPADNMAERAAAFEKRNSPEGLAILCRNFAKILIPGTPGLERFEALVARGDYANALIAYREYFFDKLCNPEKYGAHNQNLIDGWFLDRGKKTVLRMPNAEMLELEKSGASYVDPSEFRPSIVRHGLPGHMVWSSLKQTIPPEAMVGRSLKMESPWVQTPEGRSAVGECQAWSQMKPRLFFVDLLYDYCLTGNKESLKLYCDYFDDYYANGRSDQLKTQISPRNAVDNETQKLQLYLQMLRVIFDERPAFAQDINPATLARIMSVMVKEFAPYNIRMRRAEMANWGIMGLDNFQNSAAMLPEFKAIQYFNREVWRLQMANTIQHRTLDGENFEACDYGHVTVDQERQPFSVPFARPIPETDSLFLKSFWDNVAVAERSYFVHMSPEGFHWPFNSDGVNWDASTYDFVYKKTSYGWGDYTRTRIDLVDKEPEVLNRISMIHNDFPGRENKNPDQKVHLLTDPPQIPGERYSDLTPYAAAAYLREGWAGEANYFIFLNWARRSGSTANHSKTGYIFSRYAQTLLEAPSLVVDRKPDAYMDDAPLTGGKTEFCSEALENVQPMRFHTSENFDFVDGWQDKNWAFARSKPAPRGGTKDPYYYGLYPTVGNLVRDPHPITSVRDLRQVFCVRSQNYLTIVADRVEAPINESHEYTEFYALPGRIPHDQFPQQIDQMLATGNPMVEEDTINGIFRTRNPGYDNIAVYCLSGIPLTYAHALNADHEFISSTNSLTSEIHDLIQKGEDFFTIFRSDNRNEHQQARMHPISARWNGRGNQCFITLLNSLPNNPENKDGKASLQELKSLKRTSGANGVIGFTAETAQGGTVIFQTGPTTNNLLTTGSVQARGESLLLMNDPKKGLSGIVIGCTSFAIGGKAQQIPAASFEFTLSPSGFLASTTPIHSDIDTVRIDPQQGCFTDTLEVSFSIPTQSTDDIEMHYTLDGSDPTLASPLYTRPFVINETTLVKVRPFRKGLTSTPWHFTGAECGRTIDAIFRKTPPLPALPPPSSPEAPGLNYTYHEGDWLDLFSYAGSPGVLPVYASGVATKPLDPTELAYLRKTEGAFAVRYEGVINVPTTGVYTFFAPTGLVHAVQDGGYDIRLFINDHEWFVEPNTHARGTWSVALTAGRHPFSLSYVDYREKQFRNEMWTQMYWTPEEMGTEIPKIEVSGPGITKMPIPASWFSRNRP